MEEREYGRGLSCAAHEILDMDTFLKLQSRAEALLHVLRWDGPELIVYTYLTCDTGEDPSSAFLPDGSISNPMNDWEQLIKT